MSDLRRLALSYIPSAMRGDAMQIAAMLEEGHKPGDIAEITDLPRQRVGEIQGHLREGMVKALQDDGYSEVETIRYLGVPTAMVQPHLASRAA